MNKIEQLIENILEDIALYHGPLNELKPGHLCIRDILKKHLQSLKEPTEEREVVEIKKKFIDELIDECYPYDERNHNSVIGEDRLKEIRKSLD